MNEVSSSEPTSTQASAALRLRHQIDQTVRSSSAWYRRFLLIYAAITGLTALIFGLVPINIPDVPGKSIPVAPIVALLLYGAGLIGLDLWLRQQSISRVGIARRQRLVRVSCGLLWCAVNGIGANWFPANPAWWVPGAFVAALPALVAYRREPIA